MKEEILKADSRPFHTNDALLSACLRFATVPFFNPLRPCRHCYDAANLERMGFKGMPLEDAAKKAWAQRKRGTITYFFKRPKELRTLIKAFHDEERIIANTEGDLAERLSQIMEMQDVMKEERLIRIACLILKARVEFMGIWETQTPRLRIANAGQPEDLGDGRVRYPGWKEIPLNASDELKKKMKL